MKLKELLYHIRWLTMSYISGYMLASHLGRSDSIPAEFTHDFKWKSGIREGVSSSSFRFVRWTYTHFLYTY